MIGAKFLAAFANPATILGRRGLVPAARSFATSNVRCSRHRAPTFDQLWSAEKPVVSHPYARGGIQAWITTLWNQRLGMMELDTSVFGAKPRLDILHQVVIWHRTCLRYGLAKTKTRGEVRGTTKKWGRQKGSGRARHGDRRAPTFVGGGTVHGPRPKDYSYVLPRKTRAYGMRVALSVKHAQGDLLLVDKLELPSHSRTKLENLKDYHKWKSVLFVREEPDWETPMKNRNADNFFLAAEKVPKVKCVTLNELTVYDIMRHDNLVLTVPAARMLEEHLHTV